MFGITDLVMEVEAIGWIFISIVGIVYLFFMIPLVVLMSVQMMNLLLGRTTYERFSKANQSILSRS
jgi:hypothetical protein